MITLFIAIWLQVTPCEAATAETSVTVTIGVTAEVACTPQNSAYSTLCLEDDTLVVSTETEPTWWQKLLNTLKFW